MNGNDILLVGRGVSGEADFKIANNNVAAPNNAGGTARQGIRVDAGNGAAGEDDAVFLNIFGNTSAGSNGAAGIGVRKQGTVSTINDFGIFDASGGPTLAASPTIAQVAAFINALNPNSASAGSGGTDIINGDNFQRDTTNAPPLLAADGGVQASSPTPGETHLTQAELDSVVAAAIGQWALAGASAAQLAALHAVTFSVADLSGITVGQESSGHIDIDASAAGHGWFIDPTPFDNAEFTHAVNGSATDFLTDPNNAAAGHLDLLTTVAHELGHVIGLPDTTDASVVNDLMHISLADGERRLPDAFDVAQADEAALPVSAQAPAGTPIVVGTAGDDTINAGQGGNILFGGAGADTFVFVPAFQVRGEAPTFGPLAHVADYSAAQGDSFDFSAITSAFHGSGVGDALIVRAVEDSSGSFASLQVDNIGPNGSPSDPRWTTVAQLDGAHAGDAVNVLIDSQAAVHLAHIHVDLMV